MAVHKTMPPLAFEDACDLVRFRSDSIEITESDKRMLYTFYKVATVGSQPNVPRPNGLSPKAAYWDAWNTHGSKISPEMAKTLYVNLVTKKASE